MKRVKRIAAVKAPITTNRVCRPGKNGPVFPHFKAVRGEGGKLHFVITIPNAERIVFPDDLSVLLQTFGWGMAILGSDLCEKPSYELWHGCCEVLWNLEGCFHLE